MKKQVEDWILPADKDIKVAQLIMKEDEPYTNIAAFHCRQAIEKYLKAYMIEKDMPLLKIHDLIKLDGIIKETKDLGINKDKLILINEVYIESRYPGELGLLPDGMPSNEQVQVFIEFAHEV